MSGFGRLLYYCCYGRDATAPVLRGRLDLADSIALRADPHLGFAFTLFRPFLGPLYAWTCAVNHCCVLRLPKAVSVILAFLELLLVKGHRTTVIARETRPPVKFFRTDAKAEGNTMVIAGWACHDASRSP